MRNGAHVLILVVLLRLTSSAPDSKRTWAVETISADAVQHFWSKTVPAATSGDAPRAGSSTLLFVHVPKTAGSSMERVLENLCDNRPPLCLRRFMASQPLQPVKLIQQYPAAEPENLGSCGNDRGDLIFGHMPLDIASASANLVTRDNPAMYPIIMLRDPLERVVSFANFLNLDQEVFEKYPERLSCNQQTLMINGIPGCGGGCGAGVTLGDGYWRAWEKYKGSCSNDKDYAVAEGKRRLNKVFFFVGITEDFVGSMFLLQRTFGWGESSVKMAFQRSMKSFCDGECKKRYKVRDVTKETQTKVENNEDCDRALWEHSRALLAARLEGMSEADKASYEAFKVMAKDQEKLGSDVVKAVQKRRLKLSTHGTMGVVKVRSLSEARARVAEMRRDRDAAEGGGYEQEAEAVALPKLAEELQKKKQQLLAAPTKSDAAISAATAAATRPKCGDNSVIEEHIKVDRGDVCRMPSGGYYCPIGCAHMKSIPHCSANAGTDSEPCRHRNITRAFHVRDQVRALSIL